MRYRLRATAALAAAVCLGVGIGWLVWANDSEGGANEATAGSPTSSPAPTAEPTAPRPTSTPEPGALISISFGPEQIWNIEEGTETRGRLDAIYQCAPRNSDYEDCISQAMQQNGGTRDAFDFFRLTSGFLQDLQGKGTVKLGTIAYPFRANEITQPILLGGDPPVIQVENPDLYGAVERDPGFTILQAQHPNLLFWGSGPALESASIAPDGSQSFIFRYRLLDGCHACAILGYARIEYDFFPDGRQQSLKLLNIVEAQN
jgi:hypothetical protein